MTIHYQGHGVTLHHGDCLDVLRTLPDASVDSVVTDPPYGLEFMGKEWDSFKATGSSSLMHSPKDEGREFTNASGHMWDNTKALPRFAAGAPFQRWCELWTAECLRVLKPGGHLLAFGGTRTWHRLACAVEDAGFEVRDSIAWLYGSGFPKSLDVSKAIDKRRDWTALPLLQGKVRDARKALGISQSEAARRVGLIGPGESLGGGGFMWFETGMRVPTSEQYPRLKAALSLDDECDRAFEEAAREITQAEARPLVSGETISFDQRSSKERERRDIPATPDAERWQGWGTALKPSLEPVVVARKPLVGTVAANVLEHGTGALNIDGCRIGLGNEAPPSGSGRSILRTSMAGGVMHGNGAPIETNPSGRWPANVVLDESHEPVLRLRYNLPTEVERTIRESFGASTDHLPAVRDTRDGAAEQGQASEVLLPQVPGALDVGEPDGRARPEVGQAAHAGDSGADLGDQEGQPSHGREGRELEGRALPQSGVRLREVVDAPAERAGDLRADGDPQRRDLHTGAPASRGAATRAGADLRGDRAPRERTQGGQPAGEPGTPRVEQLAPDEARRGRRRDVPAATGERTTPGSPLEVLRRECPPGWWRHFDVIGHRREGQAAALDEQSGELSSGKGPIRTREMTSKGYKGGGLGQRKAEDHDFNGELSPNYGDSGGASRFFYVAKADATERPRVNGTAHPTVKPLSLMRWLVRLVTPPGGTVLEPFAGSGTTVEACIVEGFDCIAIEKGDEYLPLIMQRIHRRRDPVAAIRQTGDELGLFELDGEGA